MSTMKKALLVTTVSGFIPQFEMDNVRILQKMGYEVHYASNYSTPAYGKDNHRLDGTGIVRHQVDFVRSPFSPENIKVFKQMTNLMKLERFDLVHCHTPMGGVIARLAAHRTQTSPVVYTAHGFHFFNGAALINWLFYYPMEWFLSHYTTQQLCINQEDYKRAEKSFHAKYVDYIPGVGIDQSRVPIFDVDQIQRKKKDLGLPLDKWILLSSGELIKRKNHESMIRAIAKIRAEHNVVHNSDIHYVICGHGKLEAHLKELTEQLGISDIVTFLGYRDDMMEVYQTADIFLFPSYQEGLPMALLEAMACGLPVICSDIRGSSDLMGTPLSSAGDLEFCRGGIMVKKADLVDAYCQALGHMLAAPQNLAEMGLANTSRSGLFSSEEVHAAMEVVYNRLGKL